MILPYFVLLIWSVFSANLKADGFSSKVDQQFEFLACSLIIYKCKICQTFRMMPATWGQMEHPNRFCLGLWLISRQFIRQTLGCISSSKLPQQQQVLPTSSPTSQQVPPTYKFYLQNLQNILKLYARIVQYTLIWANLLQQHTVGHFQVSGGVLRILKHYW